MSRHATDRAKQFHLMSAGITPAPDINGDVHAAAPNVTFVATVIDPDNKSPYTYLWEQQPVADPSASFGTPAASSTVFGPMVVGRVYYVRLTIINAQQTKYTRSMRVFAE